MMKRILFSFFWLATLSVNVFSQERFTIHADFPDDSNSGHVIYISKRILPYEGLYETIDSVTLSGTHFYYEGQLKGEPFLGVIGFDRTAPYRNNTNFVAEPGEIRVIVSEWEKAGTVSGTRLNDDYQTHISDFQIRMNEIVQPLINERKAKLQARNWTTDDEAEYGRRLPKDLQSQAVRSEGEFMEKYLDFPEVLTPLLWTYMNREFNPFEHVIDRLPEVYQKRLYAHQARMNRGVEELRKSPGYDPTLHEPVEIIPENLKPGEPFVDFTGKAPDGQQKLLSEIIPDKKLILLDFWASWCGPCIKEMPLIAGLHEKYKDQGLVVIGISSDTDEQKWMRAIDQNRMEWLQFISVKGKERIGTLYSVKFIPYTVIIDGDGTILARNLRGEELVARIDALMAR